MGFTVSADFSATKAKLSNRARGFAPDLESLIDRAGRLIAVSLATSAVPYGVGNDALQKGSIAVERDIRRIYSIPSAVYGEITSNSGKGLANAFYKAFRSGDISRAQQIIKQSAPRFSLADIGPFDGGALHKSRRNNRGRVPETQKVLLIVTNRAALTKYIQDEVNQVGFGKAGWGNCAKAFKDEGATRGLPSWVTRHTDAPSGVAKDGRVEGTMIVTMFNQVPYAENLLTSGDKSEAIAIGVDRMLSGMIAAERRAAAANPLS